MTFTRNSTAAKFGAVAIVAALGLSGCSSTGGSGSTEAVSQADIDKALDTETTITLWSKVPDIQDEVDLFEKKYPKITVKVVNPAASGNEYTKMRAALKAGNGAPDVAQIEFQYLSSFRQTNSLADLTPYGAADLEDTFVPGLWAQVADKNGVWALPQDSGPLGNLYREDIYTAAGITESPKTWDEFATAAAAIKEKTGSYIANFPDNDPGNIYAFFWQAGAKPFSYDGDKTVSIDLDSPETQKVVTFWQDLIEKDLVATDTDFTDNWYQGLANGKYASWPTAAWGPVFLQGTAKDTAGLWRAANIPQWTAGEEVSGNWGGSTFAVLEASEHKIAAYELTKFINSDPESTALLNSKQFLFPTTIDTLESPEFAEQEAPFYGGQKVNKLFADISKTVPSDFEWVPFMEFVNVAFGETLGKAITNHADLSDALTEWDAKVEEYAEQQGFTVE